MSCLITLVPKVGASSVMYQNMLLSKQECSSVLCLIIFELYQGRVDFTEVVNEPFVLVNTGEMRKLRKEKK